MKASKMAIDNDLPKNILSEEKYQSNKKKIKGIAFGCIILGITISLILVVVNLMGNIDAENDYADEQIKYEQLLNQEKTAFEEKNRAALEKAETLIEEINIESFAVADDASISEFDRHSAYSKIDRKYAAQISEVNAELPSGCSVTGSAIFSYELFGNDCSAPEFKIFFDGSKKLKELDTELARSSNKKAGDLFLTPKLLASFFPLILLGGLGGMMFLFAHQREIAAHQAQGIVPVAGESLVKMSGYTGEAVSNVIDSMDKNGALDKIAKAGAKFTGKTIDEKNKQGVTKKEAEYRAEQAEGIVKGIKKGLRK